MVFAIASACCFNDWTFVFFLFFGIAGFTFILPRHPCKRCGNSYKYKANLRRHEMYECGVEKMFVCNFCGRKFHQKANLNRHCTLLHVVSVVKNTFDERENRWVCPKSCGRSYKNKKHLQRHLFECGVPPQFKCDRCDKTFKRKDHKKKHVKCCSEGSEFFTCAICLRKFGYKSNWRNHMIFKHNLTEEWMYSAL
ncbi:zinc finger protein 875-like [Adelges cooleyi]|uniref:zinc finger protein 875-like n=1 Tax=Adelges cooleyi TaxID=133065 RepID=UPI00217FF60C|nr:zinc finger protein 875-like [Adelges cooleyi]